MNEDDNRDLAADEVEYEYTKAIRAFRVARTPIDKDQAAQLLITLRALRRTFLVAGGNVRCTQRAPNGISRCRYGEGHTIEHDFEEVL